MLKKQPATDACLFEVDEAALQVRVSLAPYFLAKFDEVPESVLKTATEYLEAWYTQGRAKLYVLHSAPLRRAWAFMRDNRHERPPEMLTMVIGAACPELNGVRVQTAPDDPSIVGLLTIDTSQEELTHWHPDWLVMHVANYLKRKGETRLVNPARIHAAFYRRLLSGEIIASEALVPNYSDRTVKPEDRFFKGNNEVHFVSRDLNKYREANAFAGLMTSLAKLAGECAQEPNGPWFYRVLGENLQNAVANTPVYAAAMQTHVVELAALTLRPWLNRATSLYVAGVSQVGAPTMFDHIVVWELLVTRLIKLTAQDLAKRLYWPIKGEQCKAILENFRKSQMISLEGKTLSLQKHVVTTRFSIGGAQLDHYHEHAIDLAASSIEVVEAPKRCIQSGTFAVHHADFVRYAQELRDLHGEFSAKRQKREGVLYQFNSQLFPLTRSDILLKKDHPRELDQEVCNSRTEWFNPAMHELVALAHFAPDPTWIAAKLYPHVSLTQVKKSLETLKGCGQIQFSKEKGRWELVNANIITAAETKGNSVVNYHRSMMAMAKVIAVIAPAERRQIAASTLTLSEDYIPEAKRRINEFLGRVLQETANPRAADEVYQLNFQLFPLTRAESPSQD